AGDGWREGFHHLQVFRECAHEPGALEQFADAEPLVEGQGRAQRFEPPRVREQREDRGAQQFFPPPALVVAFDLGAGLGDQGAVLDPGGAGADAGHAAQAGVEVADHGVGQRFAFQAVLHQVDAAARGVHLLAPQLVGGAGGQAEPAVHAVVDEVQLRGVVGVEGALGFGHQIPPTNRPGASRFSGSNWFLTRRIRFSWPLPSGPHRSIASRTGCGAWRTTAYSALLRLASTTRAAAVGSVSGARPACSTPSPAAPVSSSCRSLSWAARRAVVSSWSRSAGLMPMRMPVPVGKGSCAHQAGGWGVTSVLLPSALASSVARWWVASGRPSSWAHTVMGPSVVACTSMPVGTACERRTASAMPAASAVV